MTTEVNGNRILCGDCNAPDPEWASVNRGLLLCNDCCFVHRSLGPQYSNIKSLKDSDWQGAQLAMVTTLAAAGSANHVWEHLLLDRSKTERGDVLVKKPLPYDTLETKRKFIYMKHFLFKFVPKTTSDQVEVKSQELHSTVRTASVDTTLRLLAGGADPNYFHPEKGTRPIHVAARNGQAFQVELLYLYGAHSAGPDYLGQTGVEYALAAGHKDLAQRIVQLRYSLTDQLTQFVCHEAPDHSSSKHIIVPSFKAKSPRHEIDVGKLTPHLLEQLSADLLDEVGRRQIENIIYKKFGSESAKFSIAFLPVNPHYPPVRNQARQKFARLTDPELCAMISLVLSDSEKRHWHGSSQDEAENIFSKSAATAAINNGVQNNNNNINNNNANNNNNNNVSVKPIPLNFPLDDDFPLYDSVASDEDLILAEQQAILAEEKLKLSPDPAPLVAPATPTPTKPVLLPATSSSLHPIDGGGDEEAILKERMLVSKLFKAETKLEKALKKQTNDELYQVILSKMVRTLIEEKTGISSRKRDSSPMSCQSSSSARCRCSCKANLARNQQQQLRPSSMVEFLPRPPTIQTTPEDDDVASSSPTSPPHFTPLSPPTSSSRGYKEDDLPPVLAANEVTGHIVRLIKKIITYADTLNLDGLELTATEIHAIVTPFVQKLQETPDVIQNSLVRASLAKLESDVLFIKTGVPVLISMFRDGGSRMARRDAAAAAAAAPFTASDILSHCSDWCLRVGEGMKELVGALHTLEKQQQSCQDL